MVHRIGNEAEGGLEGGLLCYALIISSVIQENRFDLEVILDLISSGFNFKLLVYPNWNWTRI